MDATDVYALNIGNIAKGALDELFQREVNEIIRNIADPNTLPEAARTLSIKIKFKPMGQDRNMIGVETSVTSSVAPMKPTESSIFIGKTSTGDLIAYARDPRQQVMFEPPKETPDNVLAMDKQGS